jgi:alpha-tubulin suppressor-like RCC1 family protein
MLKRMVIVVVGAGLLGACSKGSSAPPTPPAPPVPDPAKPVAIALGTYRTCALMDDGTVKCLGHNTEGELGIGAPDFDPHFDPTAVPGLTGVTSLEASEWDTCTLGQGGAVRCWGRAMYGQLGRNVPAGTTIAADPVLLSSLAGATAIAVGTSHTCALVGGTVKCVGRATANGGAVDSPDPIEVAGAGGTTAMSAGASYTCVIAGERAKCWGRNDHGELGRVTSAPYQEVTADFVSNLGTVASLSAGASHTCAVLADTTVRCWGENGSGQLGNGATSSFEITPVVVAGLSGVVAVAAGGSHTCALLQGGTVRCWGSNTCWNLGTQAGSTGSTPVSIGSVSGAVAISAGAEHTCVLTGAGVKCWGCNNSGELGRHAKTEVAVDVPF